MTLQDAIELKNEIKTIISQVCSGCLPEEANRVFLTTESLIRIQLWRMAQVKPHGKMLSNEIIKELRLEEHYGIKPRK